MQYWFPKILKWPFILSAVILNLIFIPLAKSYIFLYYLIFVGGIGYLVYRYHDRLHRFLSNIPVNKTVLFILVGYFMIFLEESIAGTVHSITEGFSLMGLVARIGQFSFFNIIIFSGLVLGWAIVSRKYKYGMIDVFVICSIFGIFAEQIMLKISVHPLSGLLLLIPTILTYTLIMYPSQLVYKETRPIAGKFKKYVLALIIIFLLSIPFVNLVTSLRNSNPNLFPPCEYIPC